MRVLVAILVAATLATVVAVLGGGPAAAQGTGGKASASAQVLTGVDGTNAPSARATGTRIRTDEGAVSAPGIQIRESEATAESGTGGTPTARATAAARTVTLLDGRVTAFGIRRTVSRTAGEAARRSGRVDGLRVDGKLYDDLTKPRRITLPGAGVIDVNRGGTGLRLTLLTDAGGLPAGTDLRIAVVSASATAPAQPTPTPTPTATATPQPTATSTPEPTATATPKPKRKKAPSVQTRLTRSGFAFPVFPPEKARVADNYGGARPAPIVSHEGVDIFAEFGSPVVAVADGKLSKVGTLPISGNRLWLTTAGGDAFFYAHLSSFSDEAVNGREVKAGTVLGFTGNTGDAEPTPPHVHFEVHPGGIEAPSVDPYPIVTAWQDRDDVPAGAFLRREGADTTARPGSLVALRDFIAE